MLGLATSMTTTFHVQFQKSRTLTGTFYPLFSQLRTPITRPPVTHFPQTSSQNMRLVPIFVRPKNLVILSFIFRFIAEKHVFDPTFLIYRDSVKKFLILISEIYPPRLFNVKIFLAIYGANTFLKISPYRGL